MEAAREARKLSVELLWGGSWQLCHAATEAVLSSLPIASASASKAAKPPLKAHGIQHVPREDNPADAAIGAATGEVNRARPISNKMMIE
ncbi:hypothetical protein NL676_008397 [Syzygium grande]|nr:hypothetical protein NL676_008397 [Syzygium grande]